jgi:DNA transposition AAA+ family ATPase
MTPDPPDLPDPLEQDAQIDEVPRMASNTEATLTPQRREEAIANIQRIREQQGLTLVQLGRMIGVKESVVSQTLGGSYKGRIDRVLRRLEGALNENARRLTKQQADGYVDIKLARKVFSVLKCASKAQAIGVITCVSGVGKTMALEAACRSNDFSTAVLLQIDDRSKSRMNFCKALLKAASGGRQIGNYCSVADLLEAIVKRLKDSGRLILIDEAENLPTETLNLIRQIYDATRCPVVLCGRPHLNTIIDRTVNCPSIGGSLVGRICIRKQLSPESAAGGGDWICTLDEMAQKLNKYKVRFAPEAVRWLHKLAHESALREDTGLEAGGLRLADKIAFLAVVTRKGATLITLEMVKAAHRLMVGDRDARLLAELIDRNLRRQDQERQANAAAG